MLLAAEHEMVDGNLEHVKTCEIRRASSSVGGAAISDDRPKVLPRLIVRARSYARGERLSKEHVALPSSPRGYLNSESKLYGVWK